MKSTPPIIGFRVYPDELAIIDGLVCSSDDDTRSDAFRAILNRYKLIITRELPIFSDPEWRLIRAALADIDLLDTSYPAEVMRVVIKDRDKQSRKWGVDVAALVEKLRVLTTGQVIAIWDKVQRQKTPQKK